MMEDDSKSTASTSTEFSTGSSVGSNTPSLIGENLESFCLGETEKGAASEGIYFNILFLSLDVNYIFMLNDSNFIRIFYLYPYFQLEW